MNKGSSLVKEKRRWRRLCSKKRRQLPGDGLRYCHIISVRPSVRPCTTSCFSGYSRPRYFSVRIFA